VADIRIEVSRVVGAVSPFVQNPDPELSVEVSRVIGEIGLTLGPTIVEAQITISRIIGAVSPLAIGTVPALAVSVLRIIGGVRTKLLSQPSLWQPASYEAEEPYLPLPELPRYRWENQPHYVSTQMASGVRRQRRRARTSVRTLELSLQLSCQQLANLEELLTRVGGSWFELPLLTGASEGWVRTHTARVVSEVSIQTLGETLYEARFTVEAFYVS
jgi:hypothetical protein